MAVLSRTDFSTPSLVGELGVLHFQPKVVAFAGALADAGEHGHAGGFNGDVSDELLDENRLAEACATEESDLSTLVEGDHQVDDLQSGLEEFDLGGLLLKARRLAVDRHPPGIGGDHRAVVDRVSEEVEHSAQGQIANGHRDRRSLVDSFHAPHETVGGAEGNHTNGVVAEVLGDFASEVDSLGGVLDEDGVIDRGKRIGWEAASPTTGPRT